MFSKQFCVTAQRLPSASSCKGKPSPWRKLLLARSALPPEHKFQQTMPAPKLQWAFTLSPPQSHSQMNPTSPRLCFTRSMGVGAKEEVLHL